MNKNSRRALLGTAIAALAAGPFVVSFLRKTTPLESHPYVEPIPKHEVPKGVTPSGEMGFSSIEFKPIELPDKDIRYNTITANVSSDAAYLFAAYSHGKDWDARLCYTSLSSTKIPERMEPLHNFPGRILITSLGCSSALNTDRRFSFVMRCSTSNNADNAFCPEGLFHTPITSSKSKLTVEPWKGLLWLDRPNGPQTFQRAFDNPLAIINTISSHHCWLKDEGTLLYGGRMGLYRFDTKEEIVSAGFTPPSYELGRYEETTRPNGVKGHEIRGKMLCSNIREDDDGVLWFVEAPFVEHPAGKPGSGDVRALSVDEGTLVSMDKNGKVLGKRPFPSVPYGQKALLGKTHWCFTALVSHRAVIMAPIERPKEFIFCRLPEEQLENNGIPLHIRILTHLPDSRYILCSRQVDAPSLSEAEKRGIPLCELGVIELPLPIA
jgi:hypothetical protein